VMSEAAARLVLKDPVAYPVDRFLTYAKGLLAAL
jgi:hypothetical protein